MRVGNHVLVGRCGGASSLPVEGSSSDGGAVADEAPVEEAAATASRGGGGSRGRRQPCRRLAFAPCLSTTRHGSAPKRRPHDRRAASAVGPATKQKRRPFAADRKKGESVKKIGAEADAESADLDQHDGRSTQHRRTCIRRIAGLCLPLIDPPPFESPRRTDERLKAILGSVCQGGGERRSSGLVAPSQSQDAGLVAESLLFLTVMMMDATRERRWKVGN
jgi:hypothetical protein